ncbi:MAG: hypothetical protein K8S87_11505 [Planctomycetes bacterium]|nr:hypothetical protein [Planctomycetota bacterium]
MKNVACIIARTSSQRLKQKVLQDVNGHKLIEYIIQKMKLSMNIDSIYICTSTEPEDAVLCEITEKNGVKCFQGSLKSVISRMLSVAKLENADNLIRITGDNPFTDEVYIDIMLKYHIENNCEYTRTEYLPIGVTAEIMQTKALKRCYDSIDPNDSEYLMLYMFQPDIFQCQVLTPPEKHQHPQWSLTVDTQQDLNKVREIVRNSNEILNYNEIVEICSIMPSEVMNIKPISNVKFPGGVLVTYSAFRHEMDLRIAKTKIVNITLEEYDNVLQSQRISKAKKFGEEQL